MSDVSAIKAEFRKRAVTAICEMPQSNLRAASESIQRAMLELPEYMAASSVFTYISAGDEVRTDAIISSANSHGKSVLVPLFVEGSYRLIEYREGDALHLGHYGILEPDSKDEVLPDKLFIVVPGLAFDRRCRRLGRGGGFYDRIMDRLSSEGVRVFAVGLTYDCTFYDDVPVESFDRDVDMVITENESVRR